jgi:hypothetical protein
VTAAGGTRELVGTVYDPGDYTGRRALAGTREIEFDGTKAQPEADMELSLASGRRLRGPGFRAGRLSPPAGRRQWTVAAGAGSLLAAELAVIGLPPSVVVVVLAGLATGLLALDRRLGALGAAMLVVIALPFGRAADADVFRIASVPVRAQDSAIGVGLLLAAPALWQQALSWLRRREPRGLSSEALVRSLPALAVWLFLALGLLAAGIGRAYKYDLTDILRDVRWWALYGVILVAIWRPTRRDALMRGFLYGMVVVALLPPFDGALKAREVTYDWGHLRLQFSNDAFVVAALGYSAYQTIRRGSTGHILLTGLFAAAIMLSVTRTSMLVGAGVVGLAMILCAARYLRRSSWRTLLPRATGLAAAACVGALVALLLLIVQAPPASTATRTSGGSAVVNRILFTNPSDDLSAVDAGRFEAYRKALTLVGHAPVVGHGLGSLVYLGKNFGNTTAAKPGYAPGVDDAYLTVALKAGVVGLASYGLLVLMPMLVLAVRRRPAEWLWYVPVWLGLMALTVTQSYASSGYGPFPLALLLAVPLLGQERESLRLPWASIRKQ